MEARRAGYRTRLEVIFAREAPKAVILRRGPRTHFHLIDWDLKRDVFTHGQWMKGRVTLCDLAPDGSKLLYIAQQYHAVASWRRERIAAALAGEAAPRPGPPRRTARGSAPWRGRARYRRPGSVGEIGERWTALSAPPYFSALAIWPSQGTLTGGGLFLSKNELAVKERGEALTPRLALPLPDAFKIVAHEDVAGAIDWPAAWRTEDWGAETPPEDALRAIERALRAAGAHWVEFISPRPDGDLLFACDGAIHRLRGWRGVAPERYLAEADRLLDLSSMRFALVPPPEEALRW